MTATTTPSAVSTARSSGRLFHHGPRRLVDEVVLMAGSVRPSELQHGLKRSPLDLPLAPRWSLLDGWREHCAALVAEGDTGVLPVSVLVDDGTEPPIVRNPDEHVQVRVVRDPQPYRGTAGVLHDVCSECDPGRMLLVATAMQVLTQPLIALVRSLVNLSADVALIAHEDGTPTGLMLMRAEVLQCVPEAGFFDLKEQGLPAMSERYDVKVLKRSSATGLPVRTRSDYIAGLAALHGRVDDLPWSGTPVAETWRPSFALVEEGAQVDPTAKLHDSVILRGAAVEAGALVVRSIVGPGARVKSRQVIVDQMYPAQKDRS